ncbi:hypothetical protein SAMN04487936_104103 [Halobacillus dabanensis]|uniref:Uncharacterized protein n=1 Tax=Halobacillus dabanensis TaxID=240302 RepID=A0A1I3TZD4_HALDA|nr:hypothetical protein [Halobacillus dabanensis]SFJ76658.1 hypothetical protein SAMN04487936_104103 [Halobacillus dabanensis]
MLQMIIDHIPSSLLHALAGALIIDIFFGSKLPVKRRLSIILLGSLLVFILDIPKLFGFIFTHSLFFVPFIGAGIALLTRKMITESFIMQWIGIMCVLLIGGILIDFLGNGAHLFFPITDRNFSYSIVTREFWPILILGFIIVIRLITSRNK